MRGLNVLHMRGLNMLRTGGLIMLRMRRVIVKSGFADLDATDDAHSVRPNSCGKHMGPSVSCIRSLIDNTNITLILLMHDIPRSKVH